MGKIVNLGEVPVMCTQPTGQFPYSFNGIQFWTIGGQKVKLNHMPMLHKPGLYEICMMPSCIIQHKHHQSTGCSILKNIFKERLKRHGIERVFKVCQQSSFVDTYCTKHAEFFPCGSMQQDRVLDFPRYPHGVT